MAFDLSRGFEDGVRRMQAGHRKENALLAQQDPQFASAIGYQRPMYGQSSFSPTPLGQNPFHMGMQNMAMSSMFAPYQAANQVNNAMQNWQASSLLNAPQVTQRMGLQNQRNNFQDLIAVLPQLLGAFGGHILGPQSQGFQTNYGASASMGGNALTPMMSKYTA